MATGERARYRYEYDGPVVEVLITGGTVWSIDVYVGNRGSTEESFVATMTHGFGSDGYRRFDTPVESVPAQHIGAVGVGFEVDPGVVEGGLWWPRIYATSRELVPTVHFYVEDTSPDVPPDALATASLPFRNPFYVSPNDFAMFEITPPLDLGDILAPEPIDATRDAIGREAPRMRMRLREPRPGPTRR